MSPEAVYHTNMKEKKCPRLNNEIAEVGLTNRGSFDVDSEGSPYFFRRRKSDFNVLCKFDLIHCGFVSLSESLTLSF